jgi:2',3'-cyclic-nucleotide 2'-phosphodiesterase (5'-nucleotidase family)
VRVRIKADPKRPPGQRILDVSPAIVEMARPEGAPASAPPDPVIERAAEGWKAKVDAVLGEQIGWTDAGIEKGAPAMGRWIAGAIRAETGADIAIINASGLRQNLPPGPITKASIWSILPFDNRIMIVRLDGAGLIENLRKRGAVAVGVTRDEDGGFRLPDGRPIDPAGTYRVATLDFLYYGGDHFTFQKRALATDEGPDWRDAVIAWTKKQGTTRDAPLEARLPR